MYHSQPRSIEELRAFCSLVDQERVENFSKAVRYAAAYHRLKRAALDNGGDIADLAMEIEGYLIGRVMTLQSVEDDEPANNLRKEPQL